MIYKLTGNIVEKKPDFLAIDVNGITFEVYIPLSTYNSIKESENKISIYTHLIHKEDKMELYGFSDKENLNLFKILISLSGVGPKLALILLSNLTPADLQEIVNTQNKDRLKRINGVGPKKAEKILFELKNKLKTDFASSSGNISQSYDEDLYLALISLGYSNKEANNIITKPEIKAKSSLEDKLKEALKLLNSQGQ